MIPVTVDISAKAYSLIIRAVGQDGRRVTLKREVRGDVAENTERMRRMFSTQISKATGIYSFTLHTLDVPDGSLPFLPASALNSIRRDLAAALEEMPCMAIPLSTNQSRFEFTKAFEFCESTKDTPAYLTECRSIKSYLSQVTDIQGQASKGLHLSYKANIANHIARETYLSLGWGGGTQIDDAFEISHRPDAELMRTKYCIRHELGLCPGRQQSAGTMGSATPYNPSASNSSASNGKTFPTSHLHLYSTTTASATPSPSTAPTARWWSGLTINFEIQKLFLNCL